MGHAATDSDLPGLGDPQFFALWADTRALLAVTRKDNPDHAEIKRRYDAVLAEYRRRMDSALREFAS